MQTEDNTKHNGNFVFIVEVPPALSKGSANRRQYKTKWKILFLLLRCRLPYSKVVQTKDNTKQNGNFVFIVEVPPTLLKGSANLVSNNKENRFFFCFFTHLL